MSCSIWICFSQATEEVDVKYRRRRRHSYTSVTEHHRESVAQLCPHYCCQYTETPDYSSPRSFKDRGRFRSSQWLHKKCKVEGYSNVNVEPRPLKQRLQWQMFPLHHNETVEHLPPRDYVDSYCKNGNALGRDVSPLQKTRRNYFYWSRVIFSQSAYPSRSPVVELVEPPTLPEVRSKSTAFWLFARPENPPSNKGAVSLNNDSNQAREEESKPSQSNHAFKFRRFGNPAPLSTGNKDQNRGTEDEIVESVQTSSHRSLWIFGTKQRPEPKDEVMPPSAPTPPVKQSTVMWSLPTLRRSSPAVIESEEIETIPDSTEQPRRRRSVWSFYRCSSAGDTAMATEPVSTEQANDLSPRPRRNSIPWSTFFQAHHVAEDSPPISLTEPVGRPRRHTLQWPVTHSTASAEKVESQTTAPVRKFEFRWRSRNSSSLPDIVQSNEKEKELREQQQGGSTFYWPEKWPTVFGTQPPPPPPSPPHKLEDRLKKCLRKMHLMKQPPPPPPPLRTRRFSFPGYRQPQPEPEPTHFYHKLIPGRSKRKVKRATAATSIQSYWRKSTAKKRFQRIRLAIRIIQWFWKRRRLVLFAHKQKKAATKLQSAARVFLARRSAAQLHKEKEEQEKARREQEKNRKKECNIM